MAESFAFESVGVPQEIGGRTLRFYALSGSVIFKLRPFTKTIAKAVSALTYRPSSEAGYTKRQFKEHGLEEVFEAVDPRLAEQQYQQHQEAVEALIDALLDDSNKQLLVTLIWNSLRDECKGKKPTNEEVEKFLDDTDAGILGAMVLGVVIATKGAFGPLGARLSAALAPAVSARPDAQASAETTAA